MKVASKTWQDGVDMSKFRRKDPQSLQAERGIQPGDLVKGPRGVHGLPGFGFKIVRLAAGGVVD